MCYWTLSSQTQLDLIDYKYNNFSLEMIKIEASVSAWMNVERNPISMQTHIKLFWICISQHIIVAQWILISWKMNE